MFFKKDVPLFQGRKCVIFQELTPDISKTAASSKKLVGILSQSPPFFNLPA